MDADEAVNFFLEQEPKPPRKVELKQIYLIYSKATDGQFYQVLNLLNDNNLTTEIAFKIFLSVAQGCVHNIDKCELDTLDILLSKLIQKMDTLNETELVHYILSLFHIVKLMCDKERFEELSKIQEVFSPSLLKLIKDKEIKKAIDYYDRVQKQVVYSVYLLTKTENSKYNKYLIGIFKILLRSCNIIWNNPETSYTLVLSGYKYLKDLGATNNQLLLYYNNVLEEVAEHFDKTNEHTDGVLKKFVPLFCDIWQRIFMEDYDFSIQALDKLVSYVESSFKHKEYFYCYSLVKVVSILLPTKIDKFPENMADMVKTLNTFKTNHEKLFYEALCFINDALINIFELYLTIEKRKVTELSENVIENLVKVLFEEIVSHILISPKKCSCGCDVMKNHKGFRIGLIILEMLTGYIEHTKNTSKELLTQLVNCLEFLYDFIKEIKELGCQKWDIWCVKLTYVAYRISFVLNNRNNETHQAVIECFMKNSLAIKGPQEKPNETDKIYRFGLICLEKLEYERNNWMESMAFTALHCLLFIKESEIVFRNQWIRLKILMKEDDNFQQQTLVSILCKQRKQLSKIIDIDSLLTERKKVELLVFELKMYKSVWMSKKSMMSAFENLCQIADTFTITDVILRIYGAGDTHLPKNSLISYVRTKLKHFWQQKKYSFYLKKVALALVVLNFYQYKNIRNEIMVKISEQMQKNEVVKEPISRITEAVPKDKDDECDIVSTYSYLRLNNLIEVLNLLNSSLYIAQKFLDDRFEPEILKNLVRLVSEIGLEYKLHYFSIKSIQAFELAMEFACKLKATKEHLFALSYIIEMGDIKSSLVKDLIVEGDLLVEQESICNNESLYEVILLFYINKSKALIYEDRYQSYETWKKADSICKTNEKKFKTVRAELYVILYKLTKNNCEFIKEEHKREPGTFKLHMAFDIFTVLSGIVVLTNGQISILFSIIEELMKSYHQMRNTRDLRIYSKNSIVLAQKLNLPLQCVSLLLLLANTDILNNEFDDANVKLNGIDDILSINSSDSLQELPEHFREYSPASPTLAVKSFNLPRFIKHKQACLCFMCLNWEFQRLLLANYSLQALTSMYKNENIIANDFVNGLIKLYQILNKNKDVFVKKASMLVSDGLIPVFEDIFINTLAYCLYEYAFFMYKNNIETKAVKTSAILVSLLGPAKHKFANLYYDVLIQDLTCSIITNDLPRPEIVQSYNKLASVNQQLAIERTPASKTSTVTVFVNGIKANSPPKRRPKKKLNLFFSGKDNEQSDNGLPSINNREDPFIKPKTPIYGVNDFSSWEIPSTPTTPFSGTPSTPCFGVYDSTYIKKLSQQLNTEGLDVRKLGDIPKERIFTDVASLLTVPEKSTRKRNTKKSTSDDLDVKTLESNLIFIDDSPKSVKKYGSKRINNKGLAASAQKQPVPIKMEKSARKRRATNLVFDETQVKSASNTSYLPVLIKTTEEKSLKSYNRKENNKKSISDVSEDEAIVQNPSETASKNTRGQLLAKKIKEKTSKENIPKEENTSKLEDEKMVKQNKSTKKNLQDQLENTETSVPGKRTGAIRKSVRNRM